MSNPSFPPSLDASSTASLIRQMHSSTSEKRLIHNPTLLDDEKLPDAERVEVLEQVFLRNIRINELQYLARHLSPALDGELPPHLLIYGPSGTGKSVTGLHFLACLKTLCAESGRSFEYFYVDLTSPKTCFGALNELACALDPDVRRYRKGIPISHIQEQIIAKLRTFEGVVCFLIDEADNVTTDPDHFLTFLAKTLPRVVPVKLVYVFLTNRAEWEKTLDPRILSVLKKSDLIFEPYSVENLVEILRIRVNKALDPEKVEEAALQKTAAFACRETGDARRAVELLAKAASLAEETTGRLTVTEVDRAEHTLEADKTDRMIQALAPHQRLALQACYWGILEIKRKLSTGTAYEFYGRLCGKLGHNPLTQRRFADLINFLDLYGLVNARVISKGRMGMTREISGSLPKEVVEKLLGNV